MRGRNVNAQGQAILAAQFIGAADPADNAAHTIEETYVEKKSLPFRFREKRFSHIQPLIESVIAKKGSCRIADIGGTAYYWKIAEDFVNRNPVEIDLINLSHVEVSNPKFKSLTGNACALEDIADNAYDLVHSNSVVEHVGNWDQMTRMAANFWFPFEPHFRAPFFHWLPEQLRAELLMRFNLGFGGKRIDLDAAMRGLQSATLISAAQMQYLFPDAKILRERAYGLPKSLMAVRRAD